MTTSAVNTHNTSEANTLNDTQFKLTDIVKSLPQECFVLDARKAWFSLISNVLAVILGYFFLAIAPWYLLPLAWIYTGTAATGFFVIGHDCAHRSFAKSRWVNDIVGHIFMMPLIYPFHGWRIKHNYHHTHTNKRLVDNAWQPVGTDVYENSGILGKWAFKRFLYNRLWWIGSIVHWGLHHFNPAQFRKQDRADVKLSVAVVVLFAAVCFPTLIATTGIWGFIKFWFIPWMVYHFWMSTFTYVHHTAPDIAFVPADKWNAATAQLSGTVHCNYPKWVEFLCHDINVHVPHHISTAIPSYNLRMAYKSLQENWGSYLYPECTFSISLMKYITDRCHLYTPENEYISFKDYYAQK